MNAEEMVNTALTWNNVGAQQKCESQTLIVNR